VRARVIPTCLKVTVGQGRKGYMSPFSGGGRKFVLPLRVPRGEWAYEEVRKLSLGGVPPRKPGGSGGWYTSGENFLFFTARGGGP